ncbi:GIN domain-containing protein [Flavobacterium sp. LB2R40]|uniref:GIN domain-containing protein n=1 Tax=unclassified Flavobacterium TaxID=196869 RepID=UPI003AAFAFFB
MKKYTFILLFFLSTTVLLAQKKEKIKGSKTVTVEQREIGNFAALLVEDNIEVHLERGEKAELKIETDENLQSIVSLDLSDHILRIYTTKQAINYKKMVVRVTYTNDLNLITAKNESTVTAIQELLLNTITVKAHDTSQLFLNVNTTNFLLQADEKSKIELNLKSENTTIELSENSSLKALITTIDLKVDMYQKSNANLEGNAANTIIRLDNNASFIGSKFTTKNADITTESDTKCSLFTETAVIIDAGERSEIQLLGSPKIEIRKFADEAKLIKKLK